MSEQITNYQCPSCTGPLHFNGGSGKLECEYCNAVFEVAEIEAMYAEKERTATENFNTAENSNNSDTSQLSQDWGTDMKAYSCPSCGAELICDSTTAATSCPYCGNPTVVPGQFGGALKPDYIIPFKLDKARAKNALKEHYKGKIFLPSSFSKENHIEEIKGVYVPFWLFDAKADARCVFHGTQSITTTEGDYRVTTTSHFDIRRDGTLEFEKIPTDASSKMPDDIMDSIEPFNYDELKTFSTAYLPGYLADKYDVSAEESTSRADARCRQSAIDTMRNDIHGYETLIEESADVSLVSGDVSYALFPVWMLATKWQDKTYLFAMNGQTGKLVGNLPIDKGRFFAVFAIITVVLGIILSITGIFA